MLLEAVLTRFGNLSYFCFVLLNFILRNVMVPGLSLLINKLLFQRYHQEIDVNQIKILE